MIQFSIITPVKNNKKNIKKTILSLKSQSFKKYEHLIIDGESNDGTIEIIKKNLHSNIKFISQKDKNLYEAINYGIKIAKGNYILVLGAGDFLTNKNILLKINQNIIKDKRKIVVGNILYIYKKK